MGVAWCLLDGSFSKIDWERVPKEKKLQDYSFHGFIGLKQLKKTWSLVQFL
jgi:hypothetical protein